MLSAPFHQEGPTSEPAGITELEGHLMPSSHPRPFQYPRATAACLALSTSESMYFFWVRLDCHPHASSHPGSGLGAFQSWWAMAGL